jgi:excisionase family DNA binding protein
VNSGKLSVTVGAYTFDQAAFSPAATGRLLGCTRQHVAELERLGRLRVVRLGRKVLIPAAEIERLLSERAEPTREAVPFNGEWWATLQDDEWTDPGELLARLDEP